MAQMLKPKLHNIEPWPNIKSNLLISYRTLYTPFDRALPTLRPPPPKFFTTLRKCQLIFLWHTSDEERWEGEKEKEKEGARKCHHGYTWMVFYLTIAKSVFGLNYILISHSYLCAIHIHIQIRCWSVENGFCSTEFSPCRHYNSNFRCCAYLCM